MARVIEGLGEGVALPAMQAMIAKWTPTNERAWLASIIYAGTQVIRFFDLKKKGFLYFSSTKRYLCSNSTNEYEHDKNIQVFYYKN